jgi:L-ornithine N5-oxygenase
MDSASLISNNSPENSCLTPPNTPEVPYDVVCVGFGPAALSLAIALYEQPRPLRVLFIEQQSSFSWRGENFPMDRSQMRTNLLQDLVTMRDPLSRFTFLNYLWSTNSLVGYTNLGQMNPPRLLFAKYLAWCASHMDAKGWTRYGQTVKEMEPVGKSDGEVELWKINIQDAKTRTAVSPVFTKKVILALGEQPKLPRSLSGLDFNNQILHSVDFMKCLPRLREWQGSSLNIAIVGGNDEAVEIVEQCQSYLDTARVTLFINDPALRQTDENPLYVHTSYLFPPTIPPHHLTTPASVI